MAYYDESFGYIWHNPGRREDALSPTYTAAVGHLATTFNQQSGAYRVRVETVTDEPRCQSRVWVFATAGESELFADAVDSLYPALCAWTLDS